jgi:hypothetical protein
MRDMMQFAFDNIEVLFAPRTCNTVAHESARSGVGVGFGSADITDPLFHE